MVLKHKESQLGFQHVSQLEYGGGQFASSVHGHTSEKQQFLDGAGPETNRESDNMTAVISDGSSNVSLDNTPKLSWVSSDGKALRLGGSKRPVGVEEDVEVATKRTRQMDRNCLPFHFAACQGVFTSISVHGDEFISKKEAVATSEGGKDSNGSNELPAEPSSSLCFPGYYEDYHRPVRYYQAEEIHSSVFNCMPRKLVAVGPDHQADIPVWRSNSFRKSREGDCCPDAPTSFGDTLTGDGDSDKWIRHCLVPLPDSDSLCLEGPVGRGKNDCCCLDEGSIRCVRQHIMEAREQLRISLGREVFADLGFCGMGENVALGWTEEEEHLFHEVVMSNPASLGKNFWDDLPCRFPSRSDKELVSYYFNVFMLQKRAEQNRSHPLYVDSDDDEWQESDEAERGTTGEDEDDDSGVESPAAAAAAVVNVSCCGDGEINIHEDDEEDDEDDLSDGFHGDTKLKFGLTANDVDTDVRDSAAEDQDVQDDSCTSYEGQQQNGADASVNHADDVFECFRDSVVDGRHSFVVGHCDPKPWEIGSVGYIRGFEIGRCDLRPWDIGSIGYIPGFEKDLDFLPTCNVIEEVFGSEPWEKNREGHSVS